MKKTITSAGLLVLGVASLNAQRAYTPAPGLSSTELSKPWSVSASLRGFYDDNYATRPSQIKEGSFGFELSPSAALNWTSPQTYFGLNYRYGYRWYEDRARNKADQVHEATVKLNHAFTERYKLDLSDSFVSAQEPELIAPAGAVARPLRSEGDNIRNTASATFTGDLTDQFGFLLGYSNNLYDYDQKGFLSYSALLDRMEHLATVNFRWQIQPTTVGILGYQYGMMDYTSSDLLGGFFANGNPVRGQDRDSTSHYAYIGADHSFTSQLQTSIRLGAQLTDYDQFSGGELSPYADANLTYTYNPGSYVLGGVRHMRSATDVALFDVNQPTLDQQTTTIYGAWNHRITPKLIGSALAQLQYSTFERGAVDGDAEVFLLSGLNLTYEINRFLAAEAGYNFDRLDSDIANRSYSRNRVYIGIRATY